MSSASFMFDSIAASVLVTSTAARAARLSTTVATSADESQNRIVTLAPHGEDLLAKALDARSRAEVGLRERPIPAHEAPVLGIGCPLLLPSHDFSVPPD